MRTAKDRGLGIGHLAFQRVHMALHQRLGQNEITIFDGVNDTDEDAEALIAWTEGLDVHLNLIPFNPFPGSAFRPPGAAELERVVQRLGQLGVPCSVRRPRGRSVDGACGQLALRERAAASSGAA